MKREKESWLLIGIAVIAMVCGIVAVVMFAWGIIQQISGG